jgi:phytol kinase
MEPNVNDYIALAITFAVSLAFLRSMDFIAHRGWMDGKLSRKVIHIGTGPMYVLCWLLFGESAEARWLAALVPFAITVQFALVGFGVMKDEAAVQSMSRGGDRREILRGPLYYGIMFVLMTVLFWRESPVGIVALMMMCGGDGVADLVGRSLPSARLPWNREKSVAGSLSVFLGGWILSASILYLYFLAGMFAAPFPRHLMPLSAIALLAALVESLPWKDVDNITVTAAAAAAAWLLL